MIQIQNLIFSYNDRNSILKGISFKESSSHCLAILGNNGAGKSTLLKCLNRIQRPDGGVVYVDGENVFTLKRNEIASKMAFVAQHNEVGRLTVYDSVLLGRKPYFKSNPSKKDFEITEGVIDRMGLRDYVLRYVDELSGGEVQKVMLARALAQQPKVMLLDEPTSSLDIYNQYEVMGIISSIAKEDNILVIIVIHDLNLAIRYCDRFLFIKDGMVYRYGGKEIITSENIYAVYGIEAYVEKVNGIDVVIPK